MSPAMAERTKALDQLSHGAERLFWRLRLAADGHNRFAADPGLVLASCFPDHAGSPEWLRDIKAWLGELKSAGAIIPYNVAGRWYACLAIHSKPPAKSKPHHPEPPDGLIPPRQTRNGKVAVDLTHTGWRAALEVLDHLNKRAEKSYRPLDGHGHPTESLQMIRARLDAGATVQQCKAIIGRKVTQWATDTKLKNYLRPTTLFGPDNFERYLGELPSTAFQAHQVVANGA